ncbi:hypothetical protein KKG85_02810 [Patescibacteria group bacterium]|nr:hypothetical protein [Patescibacteria group bacterium]MBU2580045.1 hypothetical protein [Patescibacteria group bacterium]
MNERNLILPGNPRYQPKEMKDFFGYDNLYFGLAQVEIATLEALGEIGVIPAEEMESLTLELKEKLLAIPTNQVDKIEREITHHDVRAWIREAQEIMNCALARWVHIPLTSYDALDTGRMIQFQSAYQKALKPSLKEVVSLLADLVEKFAGQLQIGRTHGQHALPITVGFWLATILQRILYNWRQMDIYSRGLVGKISGAVGAYNAQVGLRLEQRCGDKTFEERILEKLNLIPAKISAQILPPEPLAYFLFSCAMMSASLGQLGRDCRHLMRTEIAEVMESFEKNQVGSSTMAHKRNPINFENLEGMWLRTKNEFGKVIDTLISEHQRDLVGSCVARDYPIILINLQQQINTLTKKNKEGIPFLSRIAIDPEACQKNFDMSSNLILSEPLYIALQMAGYQRDAHELVNRVLVPEAKKTNSSLIEVLERLANKDEYLQEVLGKIPEEIQELFRHPENYIGKAKEKAREIALSARRLIE